MRLSRLDRTVRTLPVALVALLLAACAAQDALTSPAGRPSYVVAPGGGGPGGTTAGPVLAPLALPNDSLLLQSGGTSVAVTTTYTDVGSSGSPGSYTATLACGDGSTPPASVTPTSSTAGTVSGTCTYTVPGVYAVTVTLTNTASGFTAQTAATSVVVYEKGTGFVTGGGWIVSPQGAYGANPSLTGRANFGFVAKYLKGASVPTGQTEFQFQSGGLNFHSTSYDWLIVSASGRAQYKGHGTVGGNGNFVFVVTVIDGRIARTGQDEVRMQIWDERGGVVYDSQAGTAAETTMLSGGAITIHS